jgi:glutathione peroxidase
MADKVYDFEFTKIDGIGKIKLSDYAGELIMIINTASLCGFTKQYNEIEQLWQKYKDRGFVVIAVPSNSFNNQEPSTNAEIAKFCEVNFNITFPITEKNDIRGNNAHPFFIWIREKLGWLAGPKWNFYKFIIDINGQPIAWFTPFTSPLSKKITNIIDQNLPRVIGNV